MTTFFHKERIEERANQLKLQQKYIKLLDAQTPELKYIGIKAVGNLLNCGK
jgi:hypothetical protein